jgi:uncharacterized protein
VIRFGLLWTLLVAVLTVLYGCASSPKVSYYTLDAPPYPEYLKGGSARLGVLLGPVTVPEMVDRPQLVVRTGDNRVELIDTSRWVQPLKSELARTLAAHLARDVGTRRVFLVGQGMAGEPDFRVTVDVLRFESRPGAEAIIEALWTIRRRERDVPFTGRSFAREAVHGDGYDLLIAAHSRAMASIGHDIALAIVADWNQ